MNKTILSIISAAAIAATSCGHDSPDNPTPPAPPARVERTLLVYMVANNDLGSRGWDDADITEMRTAAGTGALGANRLLLMHQAPGGQSVLKEIKATGAVDTLAVYDSAESAVSIARMQRVCDDMRSLAPADSYGLVLWSHGTGWLQDGMPDAGGPKRAFGLDGSRQMNVTSLAKALDGQGFDYVYFDCCHMASVEVAYELRHATKTIAGSVTELPLGGMPYDETVELLMRGDITGAAAATFAAYDAQTGSGRTCTISVIVTEPLDRLAAATRELYATAKPLPAGTAPQPYERTGTCRHFDLADYTGMIATDADAFARWQAVLDETVVYKAATPTIFNTLKIRTHCGLSTYTPADAADMSTRGYDGLQWAADVVSALPWIQP